MPSSHDMPWSFLGNAGDTSRGGGLDTNKSCHGIQGEGGGVLMSCMIVVVGSYDPCILTMTERSMSGFHRPGRHQLGRFQVHVFPCSSSTEKLRKTYL